MKKKILAAVIAFAMMFTAIPMEAFASGAKVPSVKVYISAQTPTFGESGFIITPNQAYDVPANLSEEFGYVDDFNGSKVTALDAMIKAHIISFGVTTKKELDDYFKMSGDSVSNCFGGETTGNQYFLVNGIIPKKNENDFCVLKEAEIKDDDFIQLGTYMDSFALDTICNFQNNGDKISTLNLNTGEEKMISVQGGCLLYSMWGGIINIAPIEDVTVGIVDITNSPAGAIGEEFGQTNSNGEVNISFNKSGEYYVSAYGDEDGQLLSPWLKVTVTDKPITSEPQPVSYETQLQDVTNYLLKTVTNPKFSSVGGDWAVLALARQGKVSEEFKNSYVDNLKAYIESKKDFIQQDNKVLLDKTRYTENARAIIALTSLGIDASNFFGYDLVSTLANKQEKNPTKYEVARQGINGPVFGLIALNTNENYMKGNTQIREDFVNLILDAQNKSNGSFGYWADATPMAIQALAPYYSESKVKSAIDKGLEYMAQNDSSFNNTNSIAQCIVALASIGVDAQSDLEKMFTFYDETTGAFKYGENVNSMATEQAAYALVAYDRYKKGQNSLYNMSDITIKGIDKEKPASNNTNPSKDDQNNKDKDKNKDQNKNNNTNNNTTVKEQPKKEVKPVTPKKEEPKKVVIPAPKTKKAPKVQTSKGKVKVSWPKSKKVTGYQIAVTTYKNHKKVVKYYKVSAKHLNKMIKLKPNKKYAIKIRAYKKYGKKTVFGKFSKSKSVKVK